MKKIIITLICLFQVIAIAVSASDFIITDISNVRTNPYPYRALTQNGVVFETANSDSSEKTIIKRDVQQLTNVKDVYLMENGDVDFNGKVIKNLNIKSIIGINMCADYGEEDILYVDNDNCLKIYSLNIEKSIIIIEDFADLKFVYNNGGGIYNSRSFVTNNKGELYLWYLPLTSITQSDLGNSVVKYIASDIADFEINTTEGYYLKNNGEFYKYDFSLMQSSPIMQDVDIWQGIEAYSSVVMVYSNGQFYLNGYFGTSGNFVAFKKSDNMIAYECKYGVNDMAIYDQAIYYIGKDNLLHSYNLYDYYADGKKKLTTLSDDIVFKQIYTPGVTEAHGIYALDVNDNLYKIYRAGTTKSARLMNSVPNAVPKKFSYHNGLMILSVAGECYYSGSGELMQTCFNNKDINVIINGEKIELVSPIQMKNGRSMYPLRECFDAMGASVIWDEANQIAIGELPGVKIEFPIGRNEYWINGVKHEMDTTSFIDNSIGRTYIPIRFAAEGLGFTVEWTEGELENTISIHK